MKCAGCSRELQVGEPVLVGTAGAFLGRPTEESTDELMALIFGAKDGKLRFCEECTEPGGEFRFETYWGEDVKGDSQRG